LKNKARKEAWGIRGRGHATRIVEEKTEGTLERQRVLNSGKGEKNLRSGLPWSWK
jgi:hypothetical protein